MVAYARVIYAVLISWITHVFTNGENITESCMYLYEKGVEAYLDNKFDACVVYFENAIQKYRDYTQKLQNCRLKCKEDSELSEPLYPVDVDNLLFYERAVKATLCIVKCKRGNKNTFRYSVNKETEKLFKERKPYEYLHICYFQNKEYQKAASATFTYLVSHPDDKIMSSNLKHYATLEGVDMTELVNFEAKDYVYLYIHGADAYEKKDWNGVVQHMEESLVVYLQAENGCRAHCEGPFDPKWYPDFIPSIANHFTYCLKCKQKCASQLNSLNGEKHEDLLPSHYHYLQFAYFKMGNLKAACAAVASYLLFYPEDETMLENADYYGKFPKSNKDFFSPRPEAVHYIQRQMYERRILQFIAREYKFDESSKEVTAKLCSAVTITQNESSSKNTPSDNNSPTNRTDLSHPIHADNCILLEDNYCEKSPPAYTWRDYSAIIYLNSDFRGGEFIFAGDLNAEHIQSIVQPKCGKMVAFSSGQENLHGVKGVEKGSRFAIAMWFTYDPKHAEIERSMALQVLALVK